MTSKEFKYVWNTRNNNIFRWILSYAVSSVVLGLNKGVCVCVYSGLCLNLLVAPPAATRVSIAGKI